MGIILAIILGFFIIGIIVQICEKIWELVKIVFPIILFIGIAGLAVTNIKITIGIVIFIGICYLINKGIEKEKKQNMNEIEMYINKVGMADIDLISRETGITIEKTKTSLEQLGIENRVLKEIMNQGNKNGLILYKSVNVYKESMNFTNYQCEEINLD